MATIERFEDIFAWQKGRNLTRMVYRFSKRGEFARDFGLKDQIRRAAVSITSNIAEGFEREGTKEFIQFLGNAKGSCGEVRSQAYVAVDEQYVTNAEFRELYQKCIDVSRLLDGFITYLKKNRTQRPKIRQQIDPTLNMKH